MKRGSFCFVLFLVLLISVMFFPFVLGGSINPIYPPEVNCGEVFEFEVELIDFFDDVYDIKIDILGNNERIAKIYNENDDGWKSTYYFINSILDVTKENSHVFHVNITKEFSGEADVIIKSRGNENSESKGNIITINCGGFELNEEESEEEVEEDEQKNISVSAKKIENEKEIIDENEVEEEEEVIFLKSKDIKNNSSVYLGINEKIKIIGIGIFVFICLLIIFLIIKRKL